MATNRMYIKCTGCNQQKLVCVSSDHIEWRVWTKAMNSGAEYRQELSARVDELEQWLSDHGTCNGSIAGPPPFTVTFDHGGVDDNMNVYMVRVYGMIKSGFAVIAAANEDEAEKLAATIKENPFNVDYSKPDKIELLPHIKHHGASMVIEHYERGI